MLKKDLTENKLESTEISEIELQVFEKRLEKNIIISILLFMILAFLLSTLRFTVGVSIGGILAYINYRWLHGSLKTLLIDVANGHQAAPSRFQAVFKFIFRWLFIISILALSAIVSGKEMTFGITIGLLSFAGAAILEAIGQLGYVVFKK